MKRIISAGVLVVLLCAAVYFFLARKPASRDERRVHKAWTATFVRRTMSREAGMGPDSDGYVVALRSDGDSARVETEMGLQLAPVVATPTEIYSFIRELKLKMTFYRAAETGRTDPTCETRPREFNPGIILGKGVYHGLPVVKWQKRTPLSAASELIVEAWESPDCGCLPLYRSAVALTAENDIDAVSTEILSNIEWGEPDPALFDASGFQEVTASEFHERFREFKGLQHPLYDKRVLQEWDARQRDSLKYKFN